MDRGIIVGFLALFATLLAVLTYQTSLMALRSWPVLRHLRSQSRRVREDAALWLGMPLMKIGMLIFVGDTLLAFFENHEMGPHTAGRVTLVLPFVISASAILLWLVFSVRFGPSKGDRMWLQLMLASVCIGIAAAMAERWT